MRIAIDTSMLVGLLNPLDVWHVRAETLHSTLLCSGIAPVYFDCAVAEAISVTARRLHEKSRAAQVPALLDRMNARIPQHEITWILPDVPHLYLQALDLIRTSSGKLNFNDALIALACRERDIPAIASFDPDFDQISWLQRIAEPDDLRVG